MDKIWKAIDTLARESAGGGLESIAAHDVWAVALLLKDGRVALINAPGLRDGGDAL